jgi:surface protein
LLTKGEIQYAGKKLLTIKDEDSLNIDFALSPIIGDIVPDIKALEGLMNFELKYDLNDFYSLKSPNISLGVDNEDMVNIKINPSTGFDKMFMNIPTGERTIKIKLFDGHKQVAKAKTTVLVGYGGDIKVDLEPLRGDLSFDFNTGSNGFDLKITIPEELLESTGGIDNTKSVIKVVSSDNNNTLETKEFDIVKNNGIYQADLSFTSMKVNSTVSVEITFFNIDDDKLAGKMTIIVPSLDQHKKVSASFEVYSKAGLGGNVLASLSMNIHNVDDSVLSGVRVYLDDKFIGLSNHTGYFSTLLTKGIHKLTFFQVDKLIATRKLTLAPLEISNIIVKIDNNDDKKDHKNFSNAFKIIVKVNSAFTVEINKDYSYNYDIDCNGDGIAEITSRTSRYACKYKEPGTHTIAILGDYPHPQFRGNDAVLAIEQWGNISWKSFYNSFSYMPNFKTINTNKAPDLSNVTDLSWMFHNSGNFNASLSDWDVSNVTNMRYMFRGTRKFNSDLLSWDVSNVTNMQGMFNRADAFSSDISSWDVSNVTTMQGMFYRAYAFNSNIINWNVSNVTNMNSMLVSVPEFINQDLSNWDVSKVTSHRAFSSGWGPGNTEPNWK